MGALAEPPSICVTSPETQEVASLCPWDKPTKFMWGPCWSVSTCGSSVGFLAALYLGVPVWNLLPPQGSSRGPWFSTRVEQRMIQGLEKAGLDQKVPEHNPRLWSDLRLANG